MPNRSLRRLEWVLGGLLAIILVLVIGFLFFYWNRSQTDNPNQANPPLTAREAFTKAEPVALNWAIDAQLVNARTTWNLNNEDISKLDWSMIFYSPSQQTTGLFAVNATNVTLLRSRPAANPIIASNIAQWQLDSPEVVDNFFSAIDPELLEQMDDATFVLTLNMINEPTWTASLTNVEADKRFWFKLDANSGITLDIEQMP